MFMIKREYDYAIRICAYLAGRYQQGPLSIARISERLLITRPFATKIIYQLKKTKILNTVQGKEGGVYLDQPPDKLSVYDVLKAMGFELQINECLVNPIVCPFIESCKIHVFFQQQQELLTENFKKAMISEFTFNSTALKQTDNE